MALAQAGQARGATHVASSLQSPWQDTARGCHHRSRSLPGCCGSIDPNPQVNQQGIQRLQAAGIQVDYGLMTASAEALNRGFIRRMRWLALGDHETCLFTRWRDSHVKMIQMDTGPEARKDVQRMRARSGAIVSGIGTLLADDPSLNVRWAQCGLDPAPCASGTNTCVGMDRQALTPPHGKWARSTGPKLVAHEPSQKLGKLSASGGGRDGWLKSRPRHC